MKQSVSRGSFIDPITKEWVRFTYNRVLGRFYVNSSIKKYKSLETRKFEEAYQVYLKAKQAVTRKLSIVTKKIKRARAVRAIIKA